MKRLSKRFTLVLALFALAVLVAILASCGQNTSMVTGPEGMSGPSLAGLKASDAAVGAAIRAQNRHTADLMKMPGVVGTAITADAKGQPAIMVLTESANPSRHLPASVEGYAVVEFVSGKIHAMKGGGGGVSHTAKQTPPIQLGTSGSPSLDIANGFCCGGTLGSLVHIGSTQYILSNSHVLCGDVVSGGNGRVSQIGDDIQQQGLIDNNCSASGTNIVADVSSLSTIYPPGSTPNVDCAIAQVRSGMVSSTGSILEIGTISATTVAASVGQAVKKSGRTTALSRSTIAALNATVSVGYEDECAGNSFTKTYTGQIIINNRHSGFLNSGDSGSLMVEDVTTNPRAVGLLFAGSSSTAVANPINDDLAHLGASMVGQ
jgi:hypothetical protein